MSVSEGLYSRSKSETSILCVYSFVRVRPAQIPSKASTGLQKLRARKKLIYYERDSKVFLYTKITQMSERHINWSHNSSIGTAIRLRNTEWSNFRLGQEILLLLLLLLCLNVLIVM
jgi:hypothetical protein